MIQKTELTTNVILGETICHSLVWDSWDQDGIKPFFSEFHLNFRFVCVILSVSQQIFIHSCCVPSTGCTK